MSELAIKGGTPVRNKDDHFPAYTPIGEEEKLAAVRVIEEGGLSRFIGSWCPQFFGGPEVQGFEKEWAKKFGVKHAVSMNSATSGLIAALGALGIEPGDEVIVSPYSMCISATAPLFYGAVPVFADIEAEYLCLDPKSVEAKITPRTKAIIVVDILGGVHDIDAINAIAKKHGVKVIADTSQAPGALYKGKFAGTLSDIGVFSLNFHKHIHTGEGTLVVTNDDELALRLQLIRNHAEAAAEGSGVASIVNLVGYNFRLTELQAAIGREQLKKFDKLVAERQKNCEYIASRCQDMPGVRPTKVRPDTTSVYYQQSFFFDEALVGISRKSFIAAVEAELAPTAGQEEEGTLIYGTCVPPLYWMPIFQKQIAFGSKGFPFKSEFYKGEAHYEKGLCPVAEENHEKRFFSHDMMRPGMTEKDLDDVVTTLHKVYEHRKELA